VAISNLFAKLLASLCLTCGPPLLSQTGLTSLHGTVVAIFVDKDKIVAGADSLETGEHIAQNVKHCKIIPLGNETFFAAAGDTSLAAHTATGDIPIFDAHQVAREAFAQFKNDKISIRVGHMASYWSQTIRKRIQNEFRAHPVDTPPIKYPSGVC
jgi:hypothetical protein